MAILGIQPFISKVTALGEVRVQVFVYQQKVYHAGTLIKIVLIKIWSVVSCSIL